MDLKYFDIITEMVGASYCVVDDKNIYCENLMLRDCIFVEKFPKNLHVDILEIDYCPNIRELSHLTIWQLNMRHTNISELPESVSFVNGGYLYAANTPLTKIGHLPAFMNCLTLPASFSSLPEGIEYIRTLVIKRDLILPKSLKKIDHLYADFPRGYPSSFVDIDVGFVRYMDGFGHSKEMD